MLMFFHVMHSIYKFQCHKIRMPYERDVKSNFQHRLNFESIKRTKRMKQNKIYNVILKVDLDLFFSTGFIFFLHYTLWAVNEFSVTFFELDASDSIQFLVLDDSQMNLSSPCFFLDGSLANSKKSPKHVMVLLAIVSLNLSCLLQ